METKKIRVRFTSHHSLFNILKRLRKSGKNFTTEDTSGSFKIRLTEKMRGKPVEKIFEYNSPGDFQAMGVYMKMKKEILGRPKAKLKRLEPKHLRYWMVNDRGFGAEIRSVTNIDISKAYPYAFFNLGFIGRDVLEYLLRLDAEGKKMSRLKGMGILAKRKLVNKYSSGKITGYTIQENDYLRRCFFNACKVIDEIMMECARAAGRDFLYYWVDGIYIRTDTKRGKKTVDRIKRIISGHGYRFAASRLHKFKYEVDEKTSILNISFKKNSKAKKRKTFSLPINYGIQERLW